MPDLSIRLGSALRDRLREGYGRRDLLADVLAGLVVGVVALPLALALAVASGVPPQHGVYTAVVAGGVVALLGGSRFQVSGPTGAFVVVLAPIVVKHGVAGLLIATLMAGVILVLLGLARLGRLIQFIPHPVTTGFTAGIGVVIATLQVKDFLGLDLGTLPPEYPAKLAALAGALPTAHLGDCLVGVAALAVLILYPRIDKRIPSPLVALVVGTIVGIVLSSQGLGVATLGGRFGDASGAISFTPPLPVAPWMWSGPDGAPFSLTFQSIQELIPSATAIAILGAIESLLCAVVADGMTGTRHDPDVELVAQGIGNILAPLFGGIAATGAVARTATNIRAGARSPVAAIVHAGFVLASVVALSPLLGRLPLAAMAALLFVVAWNMSEARHLVHMVRVAPRSDALVLLTCFFLTVVFDMVLAVGVGVVLAAFLFMRRMVDISQTRLLGVGGHAHAAVPPGVVVYDIGGPLFFGAAQKAFSAIDHIHSSVRAVVLDLADVPAMDVTGMVALESTLKRLLAERALVILADVQPQPAQVLARAGIVHEPGRLIFAGSREEALALAAAAPPRGRAGNPGPAVLR